MVAESTAYGTATTPDLLRETDPEVLLATQAVTAAAAEIRDELDQRLAKYIAHELGKVW